MRKRSVVFTAKESAPAREPLEERTGVLQIEPPDCTQAPQIFEPFLRERVVSLLRATACFKVTLVVAPAGFGKSVAVRQFLRENPKPCACLNLHPRIGTVGEFLIGLAKALAPFMPTHDEAIAAACAEIREAGAIASHGIARLADLMGSYSGDVFIDDLHHASGDEALNTAICELIERSQGGCRWIIATRHSLDLPIASWLAYGVMGSSITESDLQLTISEARSIAQQLGFVLSSTELHELFDLTRAWPAAFTFAMRTSTGVNDLQQVAKGTRSMVYQFLAEQVFRQLDASQRTFLLNTALLRRLEPRGLEAAGLRDAGRMIDLIRRSTCFVSIEADGAFCYHELFRDFLCEELRTRGTAYYQDRCLSAAALALQTGHSADALDLYVKAGSVEDVVEVICQEGFNLVDSGHSDLIARAMQIVPAEQRSMVPSLAAVAAAVYRTHLRFDKAEVLYRHALSIADNPELRATIALRYAALIMTLECRASEALAILDGIEAEALATCAMRANYFSRKAIFLSQLGFSEEAGHLMSRAHAAAYTLNDPFTDLKTMQAAATVALSSARPAEAFGIARKSAQLAKDTGYDLFLGSALISSVIAAYEMGHFHECDHFLAELRLLGDRLSKYHIFVCNVMDYGLAAERADHSRMLELEPFVCRENLDYPASYCGLTYARSLPMAWRGDFSGAYELVADTNLERGTLEDNAVAASHRLLYSSAAGIHDAAAAALEETRFLLRKLDYSATRSFVVSRVVVLAAVGEMLLGHSVRSNRLLCSLEKRSGALPRAIRPLTQCARDLYIEIETSIEGYRINAAGAVDCGPLRGYQEAFEAIERSMAPTRGVFASLTRTEFQVLSLLSGGSTSRQVATTMGRSPLTVDSHVKSIIRKLGCQGRREAVAVARERGIL